jgi:hypothetical protein
MEQRVVGRQKRFGNRRRGLPAHRRRYAHAQPLVDDHLLGVAASSEDPHHAIAGLQTAHPGAAIHDLSREFQAGNVGRRARRSRVEAFSLQQIGAVQPRRADPDDDILRARDGLRNLPHLQYFRPARTGDDDRSHRSQDAIGSADPIACARR